MKLIYRLIKYMNTCISQQVFSIHMQPKYEHIPILLRDNENISKNFWPHEYKEFSLKEQDIEEDHWNFVAKSSDIRSCAKDNFSGYTLQAGLLRNKLSLFLKKVRYSDQEFAVGISISNTNIIILDSKTIILFILFIINLTMD